MFKIPEEQWKPQGKKPRKKKEKRLAIKDAKYCLKVAERIGDEDTVEAIKKYWGKAIDS